MAEAQVTTQGFFSSFTPDLVEPAETQATNRSFLSPTSDLIDPISTIAGRSGFFETPGPSQTSRIEVQLPSMSPEARAEYDRVSVTSGYRSEFDRVSVASRSRSQAPSSRSRTPGPVDPTRKKQKKTKKKRGPTMRETINALNLTERFAYNGRSRAPSVAPSLPRATGNASSVQKKAAGGKRTKTAGKKPRVRANREALLRSRSTFARAVEHLRGGNGNA